MNTQQIIQLADKYIELLQLGDLPIERCPDQTLNPGGPIVAFKHCLWMCQEIKTLALAQQDKAIRWLCFVQGCLWMTGLRTITELKADNRSKEIISMDIT